MIDLKFIYSMIDHNTKNKSINNEDHLIKDKELDNQFELATSEILKELWKVEEKFWDDYYNSLHLDQP